MSWIKVKKVTNISVGTLPVKTADGEAHYLNTGEFLQDIGIEYDEDLLNKGLIRIEKD